jgi:O-antigen ligase
VSMQDIKFFLMVFISLSLILSIEGIQHKLGGGVGWAGQALGWVDQDVIAAGGTGRTKWIGIFDGPGVFSVIYTIALPFVLAGTNRAFSIVVRIISLAALPLLIIAIYCNGSRGGFVATIAILVIYFGRNFKRSKLSIAIGVLAVIMMFLLAPSYMTEVNDSSKSAYHRIEMWSEGLEMVIQNPVFGIGRGNFVSYTGSLVAHNSAIEIMGEMGIIGLFIWIGLIFLALRNILLYSKETETEQERLVAIALFIAVIGYLVSSMFVTLEYETFYILLALAGVLGRKLKKQPEFTRGQVKYIVLASMVWVACVYIFVNLYKLLYY